MHFLKKLFGLAEKPEKIIDDKIIVAEVLSWEKHPNADRLRVVTLSDGENKINAVVCGATNFDAGAKVALALPGAHLSRSHHGNEPFVLEKASIRGVESQGMICSAYELGLSESADEGILVLDQSIRPGTSFSVNMVSQKS